MLNNPPQPACPHSCVLLVTRYRCDEIKMVVPAKIRMFQREKDIAAVSWYVRSSFKLFIPKPTFKRFRYPNLTLFAPVFHTFNMTIVK